MNPCCGGSLRTGTKIVAIVYLVFSILLVILGVLFFCAAYNSGEIEAKADDIPRDTVIIRSSVLIAVAVKTILLSTLLLIGAHKRNQTMCMLWFIPNVIFIVLAFIGTFVAVLKSGSVQLFFSSIAGLLLKSYFLVVVSAFLEELNETDRKRLIKYPEA